jgi:hypothetical protein
VGADGGAALPRGLRGGVPVIARLALAALACLLCAAPAGAHTLTLAGAERVAKRYVEKVAATASRPPRAAVRDCESRTRHVVVCPAVFDFVGGVRCERRVRVRFVSNDSSRVARSFVGDLDCS